MKKVILSMLMVVVLVFTFAACGEGSSSDSNVNKDSVSSSKSAETDSVSSTQSAGGDAAEDSIVGTWEGDENGETISYTFKANGTFSCDYASGTYTLNNGKITLVAEIGGSEIVIFDAVDCSVSGNTLTMSVYTYTKK